MSARNCPICGRMFEDMGIQDVCAGCSVENENELRKVKDYLYLHPNNSILDVSEATGVSLEKLKLYLRNERLVAVNNNSASLLGCKKCGQPIANGNHCPQCQKEIDNELKKNSSVYMGGKYKDVKMHTKYLVRKPLG